MTLGWCFGISCCPRAHAPATAPMSSQQRSTKVAGAFLFLKMGFRLYNQVLKDDLQPTRKWVLASLAMQTNSNAFKTTIADIMADTGHGRTAVQDSLHALKRLGRIPDLVIERGPGAQVTGTIIYAGAEHITSQNAGIESQVESPKVLSPESSPLTLPSSIPLTPSPCENPLVVPPWIPILREIPSYKATSAQEQRTHERMLEAGFTEDEMKTAAMAMVGSKHSKGYVRHDSALYNWIDRDRKRSQISGRRTQEPQPESGDRYAGKLRRAASR